MSHENDTNADSGYDASPTADASGDDAPPRGSGRASAPDTSPAGAERDAALEAGFELDHVTVENDNAPDECAVFPRAASEEELMTNWIAAHEGAFVDLESMR
ncbi:hypothetical protein SAMN05444422_101397 [Halobiforma haloterrestris]|uniref:DUF7511 domain-containing protein n=1 Tax=Natronobacterium haloterrestre TaxID=148448 RepID=A0A1I1D8G9_NATHA|nr:hypothetical protein [Halobiforma haloterrestris]SFB71225.1 hypothetical protein SAMN05444422_101397 [Halobiforma haloterrestris]